MGLLASLLGPGFALPARGDQVVYVNQHVPAGSLTNGTSWANAYRELRDALPNVHPSDTNKVEIWVARGTYTPRLADGVGTYRLRESTFAMQSHLRVLGGFNGTETGANARNIGANPTVLSGDIGIQQSATTRVDAATYTSQEIPFDGNDPGFQDNCFNVVTLPGVEDVVLEGLIIAGGNANFGNQNLTAFETNMTASYIDHMRYPCGATTNDNPGVARGESLVPLSSHVAGGGVFVTNSYFRAQTNVTLTLSQCVFLNNAAAGYGGGLAAREALVLAANCVFKNNVAQGEGGAYWGINHEGHFSGCTFEGNEAGKLGGAVVMQSIVSDKIVAPVVDVKGLTAAGINKKDFIASMNTTKAVFQFSVEFAMGESILHTLPQLPSKISSTINSIKSLIKPPIGPQLPSQTTLSQDIASGVGIAYAVLSLVVSITDLATAGMDDANNPDLKRWRIFSEGFNTYATPGGWGFLLTDVISKALEVPDINAEAVIVKSAWLAMYNPSSQVYDPSFSTMLFCTFSNNQSIVGSGSALATVYDNVHVENCRFDNNKSNNGGGGAMANSVWCTPVIMNCVFRGNTSVNGHSAILNAHHARAQIVNCTIVNNHTFQTNHCAVGNELGSEVKIYNSILWNNQTPAKPNGGADVFTATRADLSYSTNLVASYDAAGNAHGHWVAICDIQNSCVQGLQQLPEGTDYIPLFTEHRSYNRFEIADIQLARQLGEEYGALEGFGFINAGEGNRPGIRTTRHNISTDPLLTDGETPSPISPVIDAGSTNKFNNGYNGLNTFTDTDVNGNDRVAGRNVDMGAIETPYTAGFSGIIHVKRDAVGFPVDGKSWNTAFHTLGDAMDNALAGTEIWVCQGTYYGAAEGMFATDTGPTAQLHMRSGVGIYGGFVGTETNRNQRDWRAHPTIITGNLGSESNNLYTLIANDSSQPGGGCNSTAILDGFTLTGARDVALYNGGSSPTIRNCIFENNRATWGAGVRNDNRSSPLIENCIFRHNSALRAGAVASLNGSSPLLRNCLFYGNHASHSGGAIQTFRSGIRIWQCTVADNSTDGDGGGLLSQYGTNDIRNSILWNNVEHQPFATVTSAQMSVFSSITTISNTCYEGSPLAGYAASVPFNPLFAGQPSNNYRLTGWSPLLNVGSTTTAAGITNDLDGNTRNVGGSVDLGAYEFQQAASNTVIDLTSSPKSITTCAIGGDAEFRLQAQSVSVNLFNWEINTGSGFVALTTNATYTLLINTNGLTLTVHGLTTNMSGHKFRYSVTGSGFVSPPLTLTVNLPRVIYVKPTAAGLLDGSTWFNAFTNLQTAIDAADECSEVWVMQGTYRPAPDQSFKMRHGVEIYGGFAGNESTRTNRAWQVHRTILRNNAALGGVFVNTDPYDRIEAGSILDGFVIQTTNHATAIRCYQSSPTIQNCLFESNATTAILFEHAAGAISGCIFTNGREGAIWLRGATPSVTGCRFYGNRSSSQAAGISVTDGSTLTMDGCLFERNAGTLGGGVQILGESAATVSRSFFRGNSASMGGAVYVFRATATLNNNVMLENKAFRGGAVSQGGGGETFINYCTMVRNKASSSGGGIFTDAGTTYIRNSLLWANDDNEAFSTVERGQIGKFSGATNSVVRCVVQGLSTNYAGNGNIEHDPLFADYAGGNFGLSPYSPSVNAGNAAFSPGISLDYRGTSRVFGSAADMGAYELQTAASLPSLLLLNSPLSATAYRGTPIFFNVTTVTSDLPVTWEINTGSGFGIITNGGAYSLVTSSNSSTFGIADPTSAMDGWFIRFSVFGNSYTSTPMRFTVLPTPIYYVKTTAPAGGDGRSWTNAFQNIQDALTASAAFDAAEIWVAKGVHKPTTNPVGQVSFTMRPNLGLYGGFAGTETNRNQRNWTNNVTTLTSSNTPLIVNGPGLDIDATAVLDGFSISNVTWFAAINNYGASPTIRNCSFARNQRIAIYNRECSPLIANCTFSHNGDRCIYNDNAVPTISGCVFANNPAGAIYNTQGSSPWIDGCTFTSNSGGYGGGAIYNSLEASPLITRSLFRGNSSGNGGAIYNGTRCNPLIRNCLFDGNTTTFKGGAIVQYQGSMTLVNCTFAQNEAALSGGAMYVQQGTGTLHNCIVWGNRITATHPATPLEAQQIEQSGGGVFIDYSSVQGLSNYVGTGNIAFDPLYASPTNGNFSPGPFSPAINAGNDAALPLPDTDLAAASRKFGGSVDLGAYEFQSAPSGVVRIASLPASRTVCVGDNVRFDLISGTGNYSFVWQKLSGTNYVALTNGGSIAITTTATGSTLQISNVATSDTAQFRIAITNLGYATLPFSLKVNPPTVIYVKADAAPGGNGLTWATALRDLRTAVAMADTCNEIWVAAGDYSITNQYGQSVAFSMKSRLPIYGGFAGHETLVSQRVWWTNISRIVCSEDAPAIANVGYTTPVDTTAVLDGFTVSGGSPNGAIHNLQASPTIRNCTFVNGRPAIWNGAFSQPVIANCVFSNNADGGLFSTFSSPLVTNCLFANNTNTFFGGAAYAGEGTPRFVDCVFRGNTASYGGALGIDAVTNGYILRCRFEGNSAREGGGLSGLNASLDISDSLFVRNTASYRGGAVGAFQSGLRFFNTTISANFAADTGGGIFQYLETLALANSILWNNADGDNLGTVESAQIHADTNSVQQISFSTIQGLARLAGNSNTAYDPLFTSPTSGVYTLNPVHSPAINSGGNGAVSSTVDLATNARIAGVAVDFGAYEVQNPTNLRPARFAVVPSPQTGCEEGSVKFVLVGPPNGGTNFAWQQSTGGAFGAIPADGRHSVTVSGATSTLAIVNLTLAMEGHQYRYLAQDAGYTSTPMRLGVTPRRIVYVRAAATGATNGTTWANAYRTLAPALASADECSEIWIASGSYTSSLLKMKSGLGIYGGFVGTETNRNQRNWTNSIAILMPSSGSPVFDNHWNSGNQNLPSLERPIDRTAVLDGVTLEGVGYAMGIRNVGSSPTIRNCTFRHFPTYAVWNNGGSGALLDGCTFISNTFITVANQQQSSLTVTNCVFRDNASTHYGCIYNDQSVAHVANSTFERNSTPYSGGALYANLGTSVLTSCTFEDNSAFGGGAVLNNLGVMRLVNDVFAGNAAYRGGAVENWGSLDMINCTLFGNAAQSEASGLYSGGTANIRNTIFWHNPETVLRHHPANIERAQLYNQGGTLSVANSIIEGLSTNAGNGNLKFDPIMQDAEAGNFAPTPNSPAINAGGNLYVTNVPADRAGTTRVQLGTVDIGAYESATAGTPIHLLGTPVAQSVCGGETATYTVTATNNVGASFVWQSNAGGGWSNITFGGGSWNGPGPASYSVVASGPSSTLTVDDTAASMNGYLFRYVLPSVLTGSPSGLYVSPAEVIYVNAAAPAGGNGTSWLNAYNSLQAALAQVQDCRRFIWIATGTYRPTTNGDSSATFDIPSHAVLYGGFAGTETNLSQRNVVANPTILSGAGANYVVTFDGTLSTMGSGTLLDGVTVTAGTAAGVKVTHASPTIRNCDIRQNSVNGVMVFQASPTFRRCSILSNTGNNGAGVSINNSASDVPPVFQDCTIGENTASTFAGGLMLSSGGSATLINCLVRNNVSGSTAGGVFISGGGTATVINCTFVHNTAHSIAGGLTGPAIIRNSIFWDNVVALGGALEQQQIRFTTVTQDVANSCIAGLANFAGNGNTGNAPLFVNPDGFNFQLQDCSPLIDAGSNAATAGATNDLANAARVANGTVDMGAYEFQGAGGTPLYISGQPLSFTYNVQLTNKFTVIASGAGSYQWQVDRNDSNSFVNVSDDAVHSGAGTAELTIFAPPLSSDGDRYRCVVNSGGGCIANSGTATLTVKANKFYVKAAAAPGGDGLSWAGAFNDLQAALLNPAMDAGGTEIWVAGGTYKPSAATNGTASFVIPPHVAVYGGFAGVETSRDQRNWIANPTILSGALGAGALGAVPNTGSSAGGSFRPLGTGPVAPLAASNSDNVVTFNGQLNPIGADTVLDGFIVRRAASAGAILFHASPTLRNIRFEENTGSGVQMTESSPLIERSSFTGNSGTFGAGAWLFSGLPVIKDCVFQGNTAADSGGGFFAQDGTPTLVNCLFSGNKSLGDGGAISLGVDGATIRNCTVSGNSAASLGAGLTFNSTGLVSVVNSIFWENATAGSSTGELTQIHFLSASFSITHTCIKGKSFYSGTGNTGNDPLLVSGVYASSAPTTAGDFHLQSSSPMIEAGDNGAAGGVTNDLDGLGRIHNGGTVDLGAYEFQGAGETPLLIVTQPASLSYCPVRGADGFKLAATGDGLTYRWQADRLFFGDSVLQLSGFADVSDGGKFSGATTPTLKVSRVTSADNGTLYRCVVSNAAGDVLFSQVVTLNYGSDRWYVKGDATGGGNGLSWANAFTSLPQAVSTLAAQEEDRRVQWALSGVPNYEDWKAINGPCNGEIWVAKGTNVCTNLGLPESVSILGGFAGHETSVTERNWTANPAILKPVGTNCIVLNRLRGNGGVYTRIGADSVLDGFVLEGAVTALRDEATSPTIQNCVFRGNQRGVHQWGGDLTVRGTTFTGNGGPAAQGAGIYLEQGTLWVDSCTFKSNTAFYGAGILNEFGALATILNSVFSGNAAVNYGSGGGYIGGPAVIRNSTFTGNSAGGSGAGVYAFNANDLFMYNSIIWSNYGGKVHPDQIQPPPGYSEDGQIALPGSARNVFGTCIQNLASTGFVNKGNVALDPVFLSGISADNAPTGLGDFRLNPCSPLVDAGSNNWVTTTTDLTGSPRISGLAVDLGAYERQPPALAIVGASNATGSVADPALFPVTGAPTNAAFQWQESTDGVVFIDLSEGGYYGGVTGAVLSLSGSTQPLSGNKYRAVIHVGCDRYLSAAGLFTYVNARPVAIAMVTNTLEQSSFYFIPQGYDPEGVSVLGTGYPLTLPTNGSLQTLSGGYSYYYTPAPEFSGVDSFTYTVSDGQIASLPATVTIHVAPVNDDPIPFYNQHTNGVEDVPIRIAFQIQDPDHDPLTIVLVNPPQHGTLALDGTNGIYTPFTNYVGNDRIDYQVYDGTVTSSFAAGSLYIDFITAVDDPPVAGPDTALLYRGRSVPVPFLANDYDVENTNVSLVAFSQGSNGTVSVAGTNLLYTHNGSFNGRDTITYQISDGTGNLSWGRVDVFITTDFSYLVTTNSDGGVGSLRQAIRDAGQFGGTNDFQVTFSPSLSGRTILLTNVDDTAFEPSAFGITNRVTIDGVSAPLLVIARDTNAVPMRLFRVGSNAELTLRNLSLLNGLAVGGSGFPRKVYGGGGGTGGGGGGFGGAIYSEGLLSLSKIAFVGNEARGGAGGSGGAFDPAVTNTAGFGGGVNGGKSDSAAGGFGGGGAGAFSAGPQTPGGPGGFGGGAGRGYALGAPPVGGAGGLGGGGGGGGGSSYTGGGGLGAGGAVFNRAGSVVLSNCTFAGNLAAGGLHGGGPAPNYEGDDGLGFGGGLFNYNGTATVVGCTFTTNSADDGDGIFNVGDGAGAYVAMTGVGMANASGTTNFVQVALAGGTAGALRDNVSSFTQNTPALPALADVTSVAPFAFPFVVLPPTGSAFTVTATCANASTIVSNVTVAGSGTNRQLVITPVFGATGMAQVVVSLTSSNVTMSESLHYTASRTISAAVVMNHTIVIPVLQTNSGWTVTGANQALRGLVTVSPGSITYAQNGQYDVSDSFAFQYSDGIHTATGTVNIAIHPNGVPVAFSQFLFTNPGHVLPIHLTGTDADGDPLNFFIESFPQNGSLSGTAPDLVYHPGETGFDSFTFSVDDGFAISAVATVQILVRDTVEAVVTTSADSGPGSLRDALDQANAQTYYVWSIAFDPGLATQKVPVATVGDTNFGPSAFAINGNVLMDGGEITRDGGAPEMRLFRVGSNALLVLRNVKLTGGIARGGAGGDGVGGGGGGAGLGGAIFNEGTLILDSAVITSNSAVGGAPGDYDTGGNPDYLSPGGRGGAPNGGPGGVGVSGGPGGFGGGGAGSGQSPTAGSKAGRGGFGGGAGLDYPSAVYDLFGGDGGFGGGGGGGQENRGGGGLGAGGAIFNNGGTVSIANSVFSNNLVAAGGSSGDPDLDGLDLGAGVFTRNGSVRITETRFGWNVGTKNALYVLGDGGTGRMDFVRVTVGLADTFDNYDIMVTTTNGGRAGTSRDNSMDAQFADLSQNEPGMSFLYDYTLLSPYSNNVHGFFADPNPMAASNFTASSDNLALVPETNMFFVGHNGFNAPELHFFPTAGLFGRAKITITQTVGSVWFAESFYYNLGLNTDLRLQGSTRQIDFSAFAISGRPYYVQRATQLNPPNWTNIGTAIQSYYGHFQFKDTNAPPDTRVFYRVQAP